MGVGSKVTAARKSPGKGRQTYAQLQGDARRMRTSNYVIVKFPRLWAEALCLLQWPKIIFSLLWHIPTVTVFVMGTDGRSLGVKLMPIILSLICLQVIIPGLVMGNFIKI